MTAIETEAQTPVQTNDQPEATKGVDELFEWCQWVHVGPGAQDCEARFTGRCQREDHFHAWCRLPNPFQIRDIAEKARAAKARKIRALKDPESDAYVVLEVELDDLRDEESRDVLVQQILGRDAVDDFEAAVRELEGSGDFDDIDQHREELNRQLALPEEEREAETVEQAQKIIDAYREALEATIAQMRTPREEALKQQSIDNLISTVRRDRIEALSNESYLHTYNYWQWYVGTMKGKSDAQGKPIQPVERAFASIHELKSAPTAVVTALRDAYDHLERVQAKGRAAGNA